MATIDGVANRDGRIWVPRVWSDIALATLTGIAVAAMVLLSSGLFAPSHNASGTDVIFLAASAVTLTGLSLGDVSRQLSPAGFAVLAIFIQLAGWMWMTTGSWLVLRVAGDDSRGPAPSWRSLFGRVAVISLLAQAAAVIVMMPMWRGEIDWLQRLGLGAFHAVAAWNNAGFSPLEGQLGPYRDSPLVHCVLGPLSVAGMIGYPGWLVTRGWFDARTRVAAAAEHAMGQRDEDREVRAAAGEEREGDGDTNTSAAAFVRIGLSAMVIVYLLGTVAITVSQASPYFFAAFKQGMEMRSGDEQGLTLDRAGRIAGEASYVAASARASGLAAMPTSELRAPARVAAMALMLSGGIPSGTAGCAGAIALAVLACGARRGGAAWTRWAARVTVMYAALLVVGVYLLALSEPYPFMDLAFEATSAASNSGLSLSPRGGLASDMTTIGRWVLIGLMVLGRVGPMMLLAGIVARRDKR